MNPKQDFKNVNVREETEEEEFRTEGIEMTIRGILENDKKLPASFVWDSIISVKVIFYVFINYAQTRKSWFSYLA